MGDVKSRIEGLTPERRRLLELRLAQRKNGAGAGATIPRRPPANGYPPSFAQEAAWAQRQLRPDVPMGMVRKAFRLGGAPDRTTLRRALDALVARHAALRTTFVTRGGRPEAVIQEPRGCVFEELDLSFVPAGERERAALELMEQSLRRPFDLSRDVLLRSLVIRLDATEHVLALITHDVASDLWSSRILRRELGALYQAFAHGQPAVLPELPLQYADFAAWQRDWLTTPAAAEQLAGWRRRLAGCPPSPSLPGEAPPSTEGTSACATATRVLGSAIRARLQDFCRRERVTSFTATLAAFMALLRRATGQGDVVVGSPVAGRGFAETEGVVGHFANLLPLRVDCSDDPAFRALLRRTNDVVQEALARQSFPLGYLVDVLHLKRQRARGPAIDVVFSFLNVPEAELRLGDLDVRPLQIPSAASSNDFTLYVADQEGGVLLTAEYRRERFAADFVAELLASYETVLVTSLSEPHLRLSEASLADLDAGIARRSDRSHRADAASEAHPAPVEPETPLERSLAALLQEVLSLVRPPGRHDDFFALGGNSLASVRLVATIEERLGLQVPLAALARLGTLAELARFLSDPAETATGAVAPPADLEPRIVKELYAYTAGWKTGRLKPGSLLFGLNKEGKRAPFFWCVQDYHELALLAAHLGADQPVYGMRSGFRVMENTAPNVQALAAHYRSELSAVTPGPYLVGGYCLGGVVAREVALQLTAHGHSVTLLCLLDPWDHVPYPGRVALLFGRYSRYNPYRRKEVDHGRLPRLYPGGYSEDFIPCRHLGFFVAANVATTATLVRRAISRALGEPDADTRLTEPTHRWSRPRLRTRCPRCGLRLPLLLRRSDVRSCSRCGLEVTVESLVERVARLFARSS